jgi:CRISPR-associated protein Csm1
MFVVVPDLEFRRAVWSGASVPAGAEVPVWPTSGVAIEGDFSGIQRFVMRPVPGASGAARRLRARSFRVLALTRLVADAVEVCFRDCAAREYYAAGGRFLTVAQPCADWRERLAALQSRIDLDFLEGYRGELVFHLAGAEFGDGRIPIAELGKEMARRRQQPLGRALRSDGGWQAEHFVFRATGHGKCEGCGVTATLTGEKLCQTCVDDRELGGALLGSGAVSLGRSASGPIRFLEEHWGVSGSGTVRIAALAHAPLEGRRLATFEDLAARAQGRGYLAYLRIDADRIGQEFRDLAGDARRTWGLSTLLDGAFSDSVSSLIQLKFPNLYPVYGGGDDLFAVGPWNDILDFAGRWRAEFGAISGQKLTFSAGVSLARPRQHILAKSEEAEHLLNECAKSARDSIHALGCTIPWADYDRALACGRDLARLHKDGEIKSALLKNILDLRERCVKGDGRWHSLLFYQVERNLKGEAKSFVRNAFLWPGAHWKHADFVVRYAMLCSAGGGES